ncbi:MAG: PD-(D/E)XK nuclease family protein [Pseudomonadota bacterium]
MPVVILTGMNMQSMDDPSQTILRALREGATLVTVNNRLARYWRTAFAAAAEASPAVAEGGVQAVWPAPDILPWGIWLRRLWSDASWLDVDAPLLLDARQAALVWQDIIQDDAPALLQVSGSARLAQEAWGLMQAWRLSLPFDPLECNDDVLHFQRWAERFSRECARRGWLDEACLAARIVDELDDGRITPPARVLLLGFEDWTPQQQAVLEALRTRGTEVEPIVPSSPDSGQPAAIQATRVVPASGEGEAIQLPLLSEERPRAFDNVAGSVVGSPSGDTRRAESRDGFRNNAVWNGVGTRSVTRRAESRDGFRRLRFPDAASEDEAAARWARAWLDRAPGSRLAIVAPDLAARRARLVRLLDAQLVPQSLLPGEIDTPRPWNVSLGMPLREHGMVRAAFLVFALGDARLDLDTLGKALRSPFLGGFGEERDDRALLDARLRKRGERVVSREHARRQAAEGGCPLLGRMLVRLHAHQQEQPRQQSPAAWVQTLREELELAGWPGDAALDSQSFQLRQAWLDAMGQLARLEVVRPVMTRGEALARLRELAADTLFQPEAARDARVQVLGPLEAVGLRFDAVWLLGMHHEQWPPDARPNPFLPMRLQARLGLPHASPKRELDYLRRISTRLLELAPEVIVSHPWQDGGRELEPSPLFEHLPEVEGLSDPSGPPMPEKWGDGVELETVADTQAPPLAEGEAAPGGARMLELQSACPFRAFAELRLAARPLEEPDLGPDARVRGVLLHALLERVWGELRDQAGLLALDDETLDARVREHAREAVAEEARRRRNLWPERLQRLEVERLTGLALAWLVIERARPPFVVEAREQARTVGIAGLQLHVKLDRVDRLADGGLMIIDYKTGRASIGDWAGERPAAPQLPLYAVTMDGPTPIRAIAFAQLRAGETRLMGQGDGVEGLKPAEPDWAAQLAGWQDVLTKLAEDFRAGQTAVNPRAPKVCTTCLLGMVCRIHELAGPGHALREEDDE